MAEIYSVTALNRHVRSLLDSDPFLNSIALKGEIANFVHHYKSGHFYFTLRDESSSVKAVMFRQEAGRLAFKPQDGMRVIVRCRVSLYEGTGSFQVYVSDIFPDGLGSAQLAFEQLKQRLQQEGLFQMQHKQPIPQRPGVIGVVTSATGAALQDIRNVLQRRWPVAKLVLAAVNVQGEKAAQEIAAGIRLLDQDPRVEVVLVARGGGSREDLWVFNDEGIARAAFACKTPLISAVGHEIDVSILDFVADLRAPTPSAAAELATPDKRAELEKIMNISTNIQQNIQARLEMCYNRFEQLNNKRQSITPGTLCQPRQQVLQQQQQRLQNTVAHLLEQSALQLQHRAALAHSLSPYQVLARGYGIPTTVKGKSLTVDEIKEKQRFYLQGYQQKVLCYAEQVEEIEETP